MKLKDLKIGTQLRIGLGLVMLLVVFLGGVAWFQADRLWQGTSGLYQHPYEVSKAVGELKSDMRVIQISVRDLALAGNDSERQAALAADAEAEAAAKSRFEVLYAKYLGPRTDIDEARDAFTAWNTARAGTERLLRAGKTGEALQQLKTSGVTGRLREKAFKKVDDISDFASKKADQFYAEAQKDKNDILIRLWLSLGAIFVLLLGVGYYLQKNIREPLEELTSTMERYGQGDLDARSRYASANEFGTLSTFFNSLARSLQRAIKAKDRAAVIAERILKQEDPRSFCRELLKALIEQTESQAGAVYLLNAEKTEFEHFESIGLSAAARAAFSATGHEGEIGGALAARRIQRLTNIPADTRFVFPAVSGNFVPREIITIPVLSGLDVTAVVSLIAIRDYSDEAVGLLNDTWGMLTARMNGVLALRQIQAAAEKLEKQNNELAAQKTELRSQNDEITEYNIELELQKGQLAEASQLKSAFLSNMSHELRTPLNSVIALSGVLNRRMAGKMPVEEFSYLEVIERNGRSLLELINDILDLSRIEAGREEVSLRDFSVKDLAAEVVTVLDPIAREKGLALVNSVGEGLPFVRSDFEKCRHILQNLVGNAVKFTEAGRVEISAVFEGGILAIKVSDTGIGIAADKLGVIFDEFRQADESTTRLYGGTGLGLSIARKYATLLRGAIAVESEPGKGSVFTLSLPLYAGMVAAPEQLPERHDALSAEQPVSGKGKHILVVEDSEPATIQLKDILEEQGYLVRTARNGREAMERITEKRPDAMILDLMMPDVDGFEVLRRVRGAPETARLPVIILTAKHVTREELDFIQGNHVRQLIRKGDINRADLLAAVGKMVAPPPEPKPRRTPVPRMKPAGKPVVLVVEDNPDNMLTVRALLKDTCTVIEAADGRKALETAKDHKPDIVLMDISLPLMDGIAAFKALRAEETLRHIPVVALTARAMKGDHEEILAHGFDGYLSKPLDAQLLGKTISDMVYGGE